MNDCVARGPSVTPHVQVDVAAPGLGTAFASPPAESPQCPYPSMAPSASTAAAPEPELEPELQPKSKPQPKPELQPKSKPKLEPKLELEPLLEPRPQPEPAPQRQATRGFLVACAVLIVLSFALVGASIAQGSGVENYPREVSLVPMCPSAPGADLPTLANASRLAR